MDAADLLIRALGRGSAVRLMARGDCMEPLLRDHDWAWIAPLDTRLRRGDIVLARTDAGQFVCHRVLALTAASVMAAGDRSTEVLEHPRDEVFGRLVAIERDGEKRPCRRRPMAGPGARLRLWVRRLRPLSPARVAGSLRRRLRALRAGRR